MFSPKLSSTSSNILWGSDIDTPVYTKIQKNNKSNDTHLAKVKPIVLSALEWLNQKVYDPRVDIVDSVDSALELLYKQIRDPKEAKDPRDAIDPNITNLVARSQGHFFKNEHEKYLDQALRKANEIFSAATNAPINDHVWTDHYKAQIKERTHNKLWTYFKERGTCNGNCEALATRILKAGRCLSAEELQKIEIEENFISSSQALQMLHRFTLDTRNYAEANYNKSLSDFLENKLVIKISEEEKKIRLDQLGVSIEDYNNLNDDEKRVVDFFITNKFKLPDLVKVLPIDNEDLADFHLVGFLRNNVQKVFDFIQHDINIDSLYVEKNKMYGGHKSAEVLDVMPSMFQSTRIKKSDCLRTLGELTFLNDKHGKYVMLISVSSSTISSGHAMLLEIDNEKGSYIFYDNNRGFYQWDNLDQSLSKIIQHIDVFCPETDTLEFSTYKV